MSPFQMMLVAVVVFAAVFGGLILAQKALTRNGELALADGPAPQPKAPGRFASRDEAKLADLAVRLKRAGIPMTAEAYQKRVLLFTMFAGALGMVMGQFKMGGMIFGLFLAYGTFKGGDFYVDFMFNRRLGNFVDQFTDALGVMANGAKSGQTVMQSLEIVCDDFNDPIKSEVNEVLQELRMGVPMDDALNNWVERLPCEDLEICVTALVVQRQTGGNIAEILETLATTIRERNKLHKQISSLTAQGRMSGIVLALLPVALFFVFYLIAPARTGLMISHPIGLMITGFAITLIAVGGYFIKKIVTIEV